MLTFQRNLLALIVCVTISVFFMGGDVASQMKKSESAFKIARLKYNGGGDWYNDPLEEPTLLQFVKEHTNIDVNPEECDATDVPCLHCCRVHNQ